MSNTFPASIAFFTGRLSFPPSARKAFATSTENSPVSGFAVCAPITSFTKRHGRSRTFSVGAEIVKQCGAMVVVPFPALRAFPVVAVPVCAAVFYRKGMKLKPRPLQCRASLSEFLQYRNVSMSLLPPPLVSQRTRF